MMRSGLVREPTGADPGDPKGTKPVSEGSGEGQSGKWRDSQGKVECEEAGVRGTGVATPPPKQFSQGYLPYDHCALHLVSATPTAYLARLRQVPPRLAPPNVRKRATGRPGGRDQGRWL